MISKAIFLITIDKNIVFNALVVTVPFSIVLLVFPSIAIRKEFNKTMKNLANRVFCKKVALIIKLKLRVLCGFSIYRPRGDKLLYVHLEMVSNCILILRHRRLQLSYSELY